MLSLFTNKLTSRFFIPKFQDLAELFLREGKGNPLKQTTLRMGRGGVGGIGSACKTRREEQGEGVRNWEFGGKVHFQCPQRYVSE